MRDWSSDVCSSDLDDDIASELNAIVSVYDNLDTAFTEVSAIGRFLKDQQTVDADNE